VALITLSEADAEHVALRWLSRFPSGKTSLDLEREMSSQDSTELYGKALEAALNRLLGRGEISSDGNPNHRAWHVTPAGKARMERGA
jgi:hypothetical protein